MNSLLKLQWSSSARGTLLKLVLFALLSWMSLQLHAQSQLQGEFYQFETAEQEVLFNKLTKELRCPKCQNQSISDSDAPLAADMRLKVHEMIMEGATYNEVVSFMKERYGDFVHYRPPLNKSTMILWIGPWIALALGILWIVLRVRMQPKTELELTDEEVARLKEILEKDHPQGKE